MPPPTVQTGEAGGKLGKTGGLKINSERAITPVWETTPGHRVFETRKSAEKDPQKGGTFGCKPAPETQTKPRTG